MVFRVLDATAFYAGIPFASNDSFMTTSMVFEEIHHIKKKQGALEMLQQTGRLQIRDPSEDYITTVKETAVKTGDIITISKQDMSIIALCIETQGEIITDDFAISNVAKNIGLKISPIMTKGIKDVGKWIHYCPGCRTNHPNGVECPICATPLKRKLLKE